MENDKKSKILYANPVEACRLMEEDGSRTLAEIAELSGFNSLSTFNRAFSRHSGCTPSSYLKQVSPPHTRR